MRLPRLWRTTTFRLTLLYGVLYAVGVVALLALIYWRTSSFMTGQIDQLVREEARSLAAESAAALPDRIRQELSRNALDLNHYGLFSAEGVWIVGDIRRMPDGLLPGRQPQDLGRPEFEPGTRGEAVRLPWGEVLVIGRAARQRMEIRNVILASSIWSGGLIIVLGVACGAAFSLSPLRRINEIQRASQTIVGGDLTARLPTSGRRDEIDMLAAIVNGMMDEVERLIAEIKSVGDSVAHDLRTPLTRLRARLYRLQQHGERAPEQAEMLDLALADTDALLGRFRALLRISEIDHRRRREGFAPLKLRSVAEQIMELYEPLADSAGVRLSGELAETPTIEADADLLVEALSNLVDNAIKFTPEGGAVLLRLSTRAEGPRVEVIDSGPGVPAGERTAVLERFYRTERDRLVPGSGLGLSIVAAVTRLHDFKLSFEDAHPGLRVVLDCWPQRLAY